MRVGCHGLWGPRKEGAKEGAKRRLLFFPENLVEPFELLNYMNMNNFKMNKN